MQTKQRWLASLMVLVMLLSVLPTQVLAAKTASEPYDEVIYNLLDCEIRVTDDPSQEDADYTYLFEKDGSFTIPLEDDAFFPYEVQFQYNGTTKTEWFLTPESSVEIGGHTFYVQSEQSSPASMQQIGMWVGDNYIPAYPEEKTFTKEPQTSTVSMLPLKEKSFNLDLSGYLPEHLKAVKLDTVVLSLQGEYGNEVEEADGSVAAWAKWGYYTEEGEYISANDNYTVVNADKTIDLSNYVDSVVMTGNTTFKVEMIVGTADQLDENNLRYKVDVKIDSIDSMFDFDVYSTDMPQRGIFTWDGSFYAHEEYNEDLQDVNVYYIPVSNLDWSEGQEVYLRLDSSSYSGNLDVVVYNGYWKTKEELKDENINSEIQSTSSDPSGYKCDCTYQMNGTNVPAITLVFKDGIDIVQLLPMYLEMDAIDMLDSKNITFEIYNNDSPRKKVEIYSHHLNLAEDEKEEGADTKKNVVHIRVSKANWKNDQEAYLSMKLSGSEISGLTQKVYEGYYEEEADIPNNAKDITSNILEQNNMATTGGYLKDYSYKENYVGMPAITIVLKDGDRTALVLPMVLGVQGDSFRLATSSNLYKIEGVNSERVSDFSVTHKNRTGEDGIYYFDINLHDEKYPANAIYKFGLEIYKPNTNYEHNIGYVSKAVVGNYSAENLIPPGADNIKDTLFGGGHTADYSNGVTFTIVDIYGDLYRVVIKTVADIQESTDNSKLPNPPTPASADTYFRMNDAEWKDDTAEGSITAYTMPSDADSYYYNGYQTVFLLKDNSSSIGEATILPVFYTGKKVEVYAGFNETSGQKQESGKNDAVTMGSMDTIPEPIQYSAAAENTTHLKNYWVTFLTQYTGGPKLFVNATNDTGRMVEVKDANGNVKEKIPQREVLLTDYYDNHHDVFFANIGDEEMTNLYVKLEDAQNIALDEYWTIRDTGVKKLAAFTSTTNFSSGAKIRLQPEKDPTTGEPKKGDISGTLVIGYTGANGQKGEEQRIHLTGTAGVPEIVTETVVDGVKYVPYSALIQTNNMYDADAAKFTLVEDIEGQGLPDGLKLYPDGEIYGVPTKPGTYSFTVKLTYKENEELSSFKEFEITIADNSDENVDATNIDTQGYELAQRVPDLYLDSLPEDGEVFISIGEYEEFVNFFLDGKKLTEGTDYDSETGSTKVTVQAQTFRNAGVGKHTISAEFRSGANNKTMKRTSQNVSISQGSGHSGGGGNGGNNGSSGNNGGGNNQKPTTPSYSITSAGTGNGTISFSSNSAKPGDTVTVTVTPNKYYKLNSISIPGVELTKTGENTYTFVMPKNKVVVQAEFVELQPEPGSALPFIDVRMADWFYRGVLYAYQNGIMMGTSGRTFDPYDVLNRAMVAQIFYNMEHRPEQVSFRSAEPSFFDLIEGAWYTEAVNWVAAQNIMQGHGNGQFNPLDSLTREQLTTVLFRYAAFKGYDTSARADLSKFTDKDSISSYALEAMSWANAMGIVLGTTETTASPQGEANRAQTATVFQRFCEKVEQG